MGLFSRKKTPEQISHQLDLHIAQLEKAVKIENLEKDLKKAIDAYKYYADFTSLLSRFFNNDPTLQSMYPNICCYDDLEQCLSMYVTNMQRNKSRIIEIATTLIKEYHQEDPLCSCVWDGIQTIEHASSFLKEFNVFRARIDAAVDDTKMLDSDHYGNINNGYWNDICAKDRSEIISFSLEYKALIQQQNFKQILSFSPEEIIACIWNLAIAPPFSASDVQDAINLFAGLFHQPCADIIIAKLYSKYKLGGEDTIREDVKLFLEKGPTNVKLLTILSSGLMWMKAYQCENMVLQYMLANGLSMGFDAQQRLQILTNSTSDNTPFLKGEIIPSDLYFDVSSLSWKEDEYTSLFRNLAVQGKSLTYSLSIREEDKTLIVPKGIIIPDVQNIKNKLDVIFMDEYNGTATCRVVNSCAVSGNVQETIKALMVVSSDCPHMGILIHVAKIGKKLIIKLYTLFIPTQSSLHTQKQQVLSLYNSLSPLAFGYEGSLKESVLESIQQLLNEENERNCCNNNSSNNAPIF